MRSVAAACLLALLALTGCRTLPPPPPPRFASAHELLYVLRARQAGVQAFRAKGRLTVLAPGRHYSGTGRLKGRLPSALRVDVLDFFGRSLLNFASDGHQVEVLFPRERKLYFGPATPGNLAAFVPPGMTVSQALRVILGALPLSSGDPTEWRREAASEAYLLIWRNPNGSLRERLWIDAQSLHPVKEEWYGSDGRLVFVAELGDFSGDRPQQLRLTTTAPETELRLALYDFRLNPPLSDADLQVPALPGVQKIPFRP